MTAEAQDAFSSVVRKYMAKEGFPEIPDLSNSPAMGNPSERFFLIFGYKKGALPDNPLGGMVAASIGYDELGGLGREKNIELIAENRAKNAARTLREGLKYDRANPPVS